MTAMEEILPGVHHWTVFHEGIRARVSSYYVEPAGALIDPMVPEEGLEAFGGLLTPQQALLTNRHHFRHSDRFRDAFGCLVRASAPAMDDLGDRGVYPFWFGDDVAPGVTAVELGVISREETALYVGNASAGAIAFGDALVRPAGVLGFPSDRRLGAHPLNVKRGLKEAFRGLLLRDFDALLFAHGEPLANEGKALMRKFVERPVEYAGYGPFI
jgi:hypothetical protein